MKFDWYLFIGLLFMVVSIVTRWTTGPLLHGFGFALGLGSLGFLGVAIGKQLTAMSAKKKES